MGCGAVVCNGADFRPPATSPGVSWAVVFAGNFGAPVVALRWERLCDRTLFLDVVYVVLDDPALGAAWRVANSRDFRGALGVSLYLNRVGERATIC